MSGAPTPIVDTRLIRLVMRNFDESRDPKVKAIEHGFVEAVVRCVGELRKPDAGIPVNNPRFRNLVFAKMTGETAGPKTQCADRPADFLTNAGLVLDAVHFIHGKSRDLDIPVSGFDLFCRQNNAGFRHPAVDDNDCTIVSVAIVCNVSYNAARNALNAFDLLNVRFLEVLPDVLRSLGFDCRKLHPGYYLEKINNLGHRVKFLQQNHVQRFPDVFADPADHRQLWKVAGHVFAFTGKVEDHCNNGRLFTFGIYDVFPLGEAPPKDESVYIDYSPDKELPWRLNYECRYIYDAGILRPPEGKELRLLIELITAKYYPETHRPVVENYVNDVVAAMKSLRLSSIMPYWSLCNKITDEMSLRWFTGGYNAMTPMRVIDAICRLRASDWCPNTPLSGYDVFHKFNDLHLPEIHDPRRQRNDDIIIATAIVCGISYNRALAAFRKAGRTRNGHSYGQTTGKAWDILGFQFSKLDVGYHMDKLSGHGHTISFLTTHHPRTHPQAFSDSSDHRQIWFNGAGGHAVAFTGKPEDEYGRAGEQVVWVFDIFPKGTKPPRDESVYERYLAPASGQDGHNSARGSGRLS